MPLQLKPHSTDVNGHSVCQETFSNGEGPAIAKPLVGNMYVDNLLARELDMFGYLALCATRTFLHCKCNCIAVPLH